MKKHKVLKEVAPVLIALALVALLVFSPISITPKFSQEQLKEFAQNPNLRTTYIGVSVKKQMLANPNFLPVMGSSELEHIDPFHPSSFFMKYDPKVTPVLIGMPGTQSLPQFFYLNSAGNEMKNRKIVFIISPQWFTNKGIDESALSQFVSKGELCIWLNQANPKDETTQNLAQRLLTFKDFIADVSIKNALTNLSKGKPIGELDKVQLDMSSQLWNREDAMFSYFSASESSSTSQAIHNNSALLPAKLDFNQLDNLAFENGELNSMNNPFQIQNSVWKSSIKKVYEKRKNIMQNVSYLQSPEYADFQLLLNQFAANHDDVQFVIQPVNGAWYSYTGLSYDMLEQFSQKIKYQLTSQGFTNILDLTDKYNDDYYIGDTIHLGNRGWVAVDQAMISFVDEKADANDTKYMINNNQFLSQDWQMENFNQ